MESGQQTCDAITNILREVLEIPENWTNTKTRSPMSMNVYETLNVQHPCFQ
ncbi:hypothetical protein HMPREF9999_01276 [Alloprevotella sp. oral taxon 473 str. F0040]|nr:hypothetical protein HMPREF9999_01276 [Alloprevotella sp. oral taxon 473 str. F0040]